MGNRHNKNEMSDAMKMWLTQGEISIHSLALLLQGFYKADLVALVLDLLDAKDVCRFVSCCSSTAALRLNPRLWTKKGGSYQRFLATERSKFVLADSECVACCILDGFLMVHSIGNGFAQDGRGNTEWYLKMPDKTQALPQSFVSKLSCLEDGPAGWCTARPVRRFGNERRIYWECRPLYTKITGDFLIGVVSASAKSWGIWHNNYADATFTFSGYSDDRNFGAGGPGGSKIGPRIPVGSIISVLLDVQACIITFLINGEDFGHIEMLPENEHWLPFFGGYGEATSIELILDWHYKDLAYAWLAGGEK